MIKGKNGKKGDGRERVEYLLNTCCSMEVSKVTVDYA